LLDRCVLNKKATPKGAPWGKVGPGKKGKKITCRKKRSRPVGVQSPGKGASFLFREEKARRGGGKKKGTVKEKT